MGKAKTSAPHFIETDLGALPEEWDALPLGDLATLSTGGTPSRETPEYWNGSIPWVKTGEVNYNLITSTDECISDLGLKNSSAKVYPPGTLLVAMYGQGITRGRAAILGIEAAINQACAAIRVGERIDTEYLLYAFTHQYESIRELGHGANQRNLNMLILRRVVFPVPPLPEQKAVVQVLRTVQQAKEAAEKVIAACRHVKQSLMRHLFTYGVVPFDQADKVKLKETEIGEMPVDWEIMSMEKMCADGKGSIQTGPFGSQLHSSDYKQEGVPVINPTHMGFNTIDGNDPPRISQADADRLAKHYLTTGDILISRRGDFGKYSYIRQGNEGWLCGTGCIRLRLTNPKIDNFFVSLSIGTERIQTYLRDKAVGTIMPNLNEKILNGIEFGLPPLEDQVQTCEVLRAVSEKQHAEESRWTSLTTLFNTLLHNLMTGKVRV